MPTKERIINTALQLFNENGTKSVSTNHIAEAMGISPGNLYYHFRNKEEIIRAIFDQMSAVGFEEYEQTISVYPLGSPLAMEATFLMIQRFNWRYRFFKRELTSLIFSDAELQDRYQIIHKQMLQLIRSTFEISIENGIMKPMSEAELSLFTEEIWILTLFWLNYLEAGKEEINESSLERGSDLLRQTIKYRLTEIGLKALNTK